MVSPLLKKLGRDLIRLKGQAITIALVVMAGVACWVGLRSTLESLHGARDAYYERQRFGDVFVDCERAPMTELEHIDAIRGVEASAATIVTPIRFLMDATPRPVGVLVGSPAGVTPAVDAPRLVTGRFAERGRRDEAVMLASFAKSQRLAEGDVVLVAVSGVELRVRVVGTAIAPDYLFAVAPGDVSADENGFGVLWMDIDAVGDLTNRRGAFTHLSVRLSPGANEKEVLSEVDRALEPWGGRGAKTRSEQPSNRVLDQELGQLRGMALVAPTIFLGVAAFLLNAVLARLVMLERPEIAALRALGYTGFEVAKHYVELVLCIALFGSALGIGLGAEVGRWVTDLYARYFHFPDPPFTLSAGTVAFGVAVSVGSALVGALSAAMRIVKLPPAEAMRPLAPATFHRGVVDRFLMAWLSPTVRMILRGTIRKPGRVLLSTLALSFSIAICIIGRFNADVLDEFLTIQFSAAMREDLSVTFRRTVDASALGSLKSRRGIVRAEGLSTTPVELSHGNARRERVLVGHPDDAALRVLVDRHGARVDIPPNGIAIDDYTARVLSVSEGDSVILRPLEGDRRPREVRVGRVFDALTALESHARMEDKRALTGEAGINQAMISVAPGAGQEVERALYDMPEVYAVGRREGAIERFEEVSGESMTTMSLILTAFAMVIAIGVVYNDARIALSSQERELASLRVLGLTNGEVSSILLGQLALPVVLSAAPGLVIGYGLAELMASSVDPELYRLPVVIKPVTYAFAIAVVVVAAILSALLVRRRVDHLDLIGVLKTRE